MEDVIIAGARLAGATAARELVARGVRVLEARSRVGGRARTTTVDGQRFELGGAGEVSQIVVAAGGERTAPPTEEAFALLGAGYAALYASKPDAAALFPLPYAPLAGGAWPTVEQIAHADRVAQLRLDWPADALLGTMLAIDVSGDRGRVAGCSRRSVVVRRSACSQRSVAVAVPL